MIHQAFWLEYARRYAHGDEPLQLRVKTGVAASDSGTRILRGSKITLLRERVVPTMAIVQSAGARACFSRHFGPRPRM
jgi:hypothetical protein